VVIINYQIIKINLNFDSFCKYFLIFDKIGTMISIWIQWLSLYADCSLPPSAAGMRLRRTAVVAAFQMAAAAAEQPAAARPQRG
jgi:hypothetical protein